MNIHNQINIVWRYTFYSLVCVFSCLSSLIIPTNTHAFSADIEGVHLDLNSQNLTNTDSIGPFWRSIHETSTFNSRNDDNYVLFDIYVPGSFCIFVPTAPINSSFRLFRIENGIGHPVGEFKKDSNSRFLYLTSGTYILKCTFAGANPHITLDFFPDNATGKTANLIPKSSLNADSTWIPIFYQREIAPFIQGIFDELTLKIGFTTKADFIFRTAYADYIDSFYDCYSIMSDPTIDADFIVDQTLEIIGQKARSELEASGYPISGLAAETLLEHLEVADDLFKIVATGGVGTPSSWASVWQRASSDAVIIASSIIGRVILDGIAEKSTETLIANIILEQLCVGNYGRWSAFDNMYGTRDIKTIAGKIATQIGKENYLFFSNKYNKENVELIVLTALNNLGSWVTTRKRKDNPFKDVDGDGYDNTMEVVMGTNPNDANDPQPPTGKPVALFSVTSSGNVSSAVTLDAANSSSPNGPLSFQWELYGPNGVTIHFTDANAPSTAFTPTIEGTYTAKLTVTDNYYSDSAFKQIPISAPHPDIIIEIKEDKKHIYIEELTIPACSNGRLTTVGSFTVPPGEKWTSIKFAASKGDALLIARKNRAPEWKSGRCGAWEFYGEEYDWYKATKIYTWDEDLVAGDTIQLAAISYAGIDDFKINSIVSVTKDLDEDGVPDDQESPACVANSDETFDSDGDLICNNEDKFDNDIAASLDTDTDGYPDKWNSGYGKTDSTTGLTLDAFQFDATAAIDSDGDGFPDEWIVQTRQEVSPTGLKLDHFPNDPAAAIDSDGDGYPDLWNPGRNQTDSTTGLTIDIFPNDPAAALDSDGDGNPDQWNNGFTQADSTLNLTLDAFPWDKAASVDSDRDGAPDHWNENMSQRDSTTGLYLDEFPLDPTEQRDTDGDGVGDNADYAPLDKNRWNNHPPTLEKLPNLTMSTNQHINIPLHISDVDNDEVHIQVVSGHTYCTYHEGGISITSGTTDDIELITIQACDNFGGRTTISFMLTISCVPGECSFTPSVSALNVSEHGSKQSITVTTSDHCSWTAVSDEEWIHINGETSKLGTDIVYIDIDPLDNTELRTGHIKVEDTLITVRQTKSTSLLSPGTILLLLQ